MSRVYDTEDVLEVLRDRPRAEYPVMTAPEIAEELGASRPTVNKRLEELVESGEVEWHQFGPARAYRLANERLTVKEAEMLPDGGEILDDNKSIQKYQQRTAAGAFLSALLGAGTGVALFVFPPIVAGAVLFLMISCSFVTVAFTIQLIIIQRDLGEKLQRAVTSGLKTSNEPATDAEAAE